MLNKFIIFSSGDIPSGHCGTDGESSGGLEPESVIRQQEGCLTCAVGETGIRGRIFALGRDCINDRINDWFTFRVQQDGFSQAGPLGQQLGLLCAGAQIGYIDTDL